jgi:hypothetical protein
MVGEFVLFQIGKAYDRKGRKQGRTRVYGAVPDRVPYLGGVRPSSPGLPGEHLLRYRRARSSDHLLPVQVPVVLDGIDILDHALRTVKARGDAARSSVITNIPGACGGPRRSFSLIARQGVGMQLHAT